MSVPSGAYIEKAVARRIANLSLKEWLGLPRKDQKSYLEAGRRALQAMRMHERYQAKLEAKKAG